jgi:DNA-binding transcriptional LysR family regulator
MMLKQFEDHLAAPLFEGARKSRLTPLGQMIHAEARRELDHFARTVAMIEGHSRAELGCVRLAVTPSIATAVLPPVVRRFMADHPKVRVDLRDMNSSAVQHELERERADIGIATLGPMPGFDRKRFFSDGFGIVCRSDHPLAAERGSVGWADIAGFDLIANGLCALIREEDFAPILAASRLSVPNTASLLGFVRAGVGITILPRLAVLEEHDGLIFRPLAETSAHRDVYVVSQPVPNLAPAARAFLAALIDAGLPGYLNRRPA